MNRTDSIQTSNSIAPDRTGALSVLRFYRKRQAVSPSPRGCYPNYTTAEGCSALNAPHYWSRKHGSRLVFALFEH